MGFEELKKEIIDEAKAKADKIKADAKEEVKRIKKEAEAEIRQKEKNVKEETKKTVELMTTGATSSSKLEAKKLVLEIRKKQIDNLFENVNESVNRDIKAAEKKTIFKKLLARAEEQIDVKTVYANKDDVKLLKTITKYDVEESDIIGGIVAEDSKGEVKVDLSFNYYIDTVKDKYLTEISEMLF